MAMLDSEDGVLDHPLTRTLAAIEYDAIFLPFLMEYILHYAHIKGIG